MKINLLRRIAILTLYIGLACLLWLGVRYDNDLPELSWIESWRGIPYFIALTVIWLIPFLVLLVVAHLVIAAVAKRWRKQVLTVCVVSLGCVLVALWQMGHSWRLVPAYFIGHRYNPQQTPVDPKLVYAAPEWILERQLDALIGETGSLPLSATSPLADYTFKRVQIVGWWKQDVRAIVQTELRFMDGTARDVALEIEAADSGYEVIFNIDLQVDVPYWIEQDSSLAKLIKPTPVTQTLSSEPAPVTLEAVHLLDRNELEPALEPEQTSAYLSHISVMDIDQSGNLLVQMHLRNGLEFDGSVLLFVEPGSSADVLHMDDRAFAQAHFSAEKNQIAFLERNIENFPGQVTDLVWIGSRESEFEVVDSARQFTFASAQNDDTLLYLNNGTAYTHTAEKTTKLNIQPDDALYPIRFVAPAPTPGRFAFGDTARRFWLTDGDKQTQLGWIGWNRRAMWRGDGELLAWTDEDNQSLLQRSLFIYDTTQETTQPIPLADGVGAPLCWVDERHLLLSGASLYNDQPLYVVDVISAEIWQLPETTYGADNVICTNGYIALRSSNTNQTLYKIEQN